MPPFNLAPTEFALEPDESVEIVVDYLPLELGQHVGRQHRRPRAAEHGAVFRADKGCEHREVCGAVQTAREGATSGCAPPGRCCGAWTRRRRKRRKRKKRRIRIRRTRKEASLTRAKAQGASRCARLSAPECESCRLPAAIRAR